MNKTYIIGYLSFFDNELILKKVQATSKRDAIIRYFSSENEEWQDYEFAPTHEQIILDLRNCDIAMNVIEVK